MSTAPGLFVRSREQMAALRGEGHLHHAIVVVAERTQPVSCRPRATAGRGLCRRSPAAAVRRQSGRPDRLGVRADLPEFPTRGDLPQPAGAVVTRGNRACAIATHGQRIDRAGVAAPGRQAFAGVRVPAMDQPIGVGGAADQRLAVRREGQGADQVRMPKIMERSGGSRDSRASPRFAVGHRESLAIRREHGREALPPQGRGVCAAACRSRRPRLA